MGGQRVAREVREAVADDIRATFGTPEGSVRKIAARRGVSQTTVRRVADEIGATNEAARAIIENAAKTTKANNAQRRADISKMLLDVAEEAIRDMDRPSVIYNFGGKDNTYAEKRVSRPPFADRRQLATIAAIALDKHIVIERLDASASGGSEIDRFLKGMAGEAGDDGA